MVSDDDFQAMVDELVKLQAQVDRIEANQAQPESGTTVCSGADARQADKAPHPVMRWFDGSPVMVDRKDLEAEAAVSPLEIAMSEPKHTPGPWRVVGPSLDGANSRRIFSGYEYVALVGGSDQSTETIEANARLIAAAPDAVTEVALAAFEEWLDSEIEAADERYRNQPNEHTAVPPLIMKLVRGKYQQFRRQYRSAGGTPCGFPVQRKRSQMHSCSQCQENHRQLIEINERLRALEAKDSSSESSVCSGADARPADDGDLPTMRSLYGACQDSPVDIAGDWGKSEEVSPRSGDGHVPTPVISKSNVVVSLFFDSPEEADEAFDKLVEWYGQAE